ncbi:ParA family protein [Sphingosinicella soli]|uniref:Cellulose biosynthesis protein BcsQ n=1 Tax=Sphingosinicella soli TaxID=333708 RepID=A0A7W7AZS3_9SPHN|nr:ParA family protein [Sphingosinicella soli]MBB4631214.1 cellulose biosynthesis protein BcsQ [Sphingosinicella soli]
MKIIAVFSLKGGVGKTSVAVNVAHLLATRAKRRTLLWDLDAQGAASDLLQVEPSKKARKLFAGTGGGDIEAYIVPSKWPGLDVLAADESLRKLDVQLVESQRAKLLARRLAAIAGEYDRVVLDCPPGFGLLAEQVFRAADLIVEPMTMSPLSARTNEQLAEHLARHHKGQPPVLPVFTMVDKRRALHRETLEACPDVHAIPYSSKVEEMAVYCLPLAEIAPDSPETAEFGRLVTAIERKLTRPGQPRKG